MTEARDLSGFLHVHAEVDQVEEHLDVPLRLHVSAHYAEREPRAAVLQNHRRNERVEWPFAGRELIRVSGL